MLFVIIIIIFANKWYAKRSLDCFVGIGGKEEFVGRSDKY